MFNRENAVGIVLLAVCAVMAGVLLYYIAIGDRPTIDLGPAGSVIGLALFVGLVVFGLARGGFLRRLRGGGGGRQWPDPGTGQKSLWDRLRGK